jgi:DNA-binding PadR family transcriptional regulator
MCDWVFSILGLVGDMTKKTGYLGELEQMVLLAILQLDDQAFGTNVMDELERRVERRVSRGALYVTLDRLEEKEMLTSRLGDPTPRRGGRPKRFLTVTAGGVAALQKSRNAWMRLWDGLDSVFERR